ncbi:MAG: hypothetical protein HY290_07485 [Planctomycetia bacterium]|nr:hypothetical protein [Planctomycetia bacterium]
MPDSSPVRAWRPPTPVHFTGGTSHVGSNSFSQSVSKSNIGTTARTGGTVSTGGTSQAMKKIGTGSTIQSNNTIHSNNTIKLPTNTGKIGTGNNKLGVVGNNNIHAHDLHQNIANTSDRLKNGHLDHIVSTKTAHDLDLKKQFDMHKQGDVARRLNLTHDFAKNGGMGKHLQGPLSANFHKNVFSHCYCGPGFYNNFCLFPHWCPWVNWCWNYNCLPWFDPRPFCCRPCFYLPCQPWIVWNYPVWCGLPVCYCGTWVDVPVVSVPVGYDLQLLAVRFVDAGHPEQGYGPRYRVWFRNNSSVAMVQPFDVLAYASNSELPAAGMPSAGVRVTGMNPGQVQSVDLRLPAEANAMAADLNGQKSPFKFLHVIVDSQREVAETDEANNGAVLDRLQVLPVDPAIFSASLSASSNGATINIAGEGFGPEAGRILINLRGTEMPAEIQGWYDLGVQIRVPNLSANDALKADVTVVRGDRAASNPATVKLPVAADAAPQPVQ